MKMHSIAAALLAVGLAFPAFAVELTPPAEPKGSVPVVTLPKGEPIIVSELLLEEMTWPEIRDALAKGKTTVIIPTGGAEQTGPHIVTGKHNFILEYTSLMIAHRLGDTLVAPIIPIVPEGSISPPEGNMLHPGTISLRPSTFAALLEDTARSLKQHGFKTICLIGEHGGSQPVLKVVAEGLSEEWKKEGVKVLYINEYYDEQNGQLEALKKMGQNDPNPQAHGGLADTSEMMAVKPKGVREQLRGPYGANDFATLGVDGSSNKASLIIGAKLVDLKVEGAVKQIKRERQK